MAVAASNAVSDLDFESMRIHYTEAHFLDDVCWYGLPNQFNDLLATTLEDVLSTFAEHALA